MCVDVQINRSLSQVFLCQTEAIFKRAVWEKNVQLLVRRNQEASAERHGFTLGLSHLADMVSVQQFVLTVSWTEHRCPNTAVTPRVCGILPYVHWNMHTALVIITALIALFHRWLMIAQECFTSLAVCRNLFYCKSTAVYISAARFSPDMITSNRLQHTSTFIVHVIGTYKKSYNPGLGILKVQHFPVKKKSARLWSMSPDVSERPLVDINCMKTPSAPLVAPELSILNCVLTLPDLCWCNTEQNSCSACKPAPSVPQFTPSPIDQLQSSVIQSV